MKPHITPTVFLAAAALLVTEQGMAAGFYMTQVGTPLSIGTVGVVNTVNTWGADAAWAQPAGMVNLPEGTVGVTGLTLMVPEMKFDSSVAEAGGKDGGNAGDIAAVPSQFLVKKLSDQTSVGLAITAPLGGAMDFGNDFVGRYGAKGLAYIKVNDAAAGRDGLQSPILKFLPDDAVNGILERTGAKTGDLIFFGADKANIVNDALGALRVKLGEDRGLVAEGWSPLWVVDFPMFEKDAQSKRWMALHHPFTAPSVNDADALKADPGNALSRAYDMVLNGSEIGGGSIVIHTKGKK